jgi:hypothetical protein
MVNGPTPTRFAHTGVSPHSHSLYMGCSGYYDDFVLRIKRPLTTLRICRLARVFMKHVHFDLGLCFVIRVIDKSEQFVYQGGREIWSAVRVWYCATEERHDSRGSPSHPMYRFVSYERHYDSKPYCLLQVIG